MRKPDPSSSRDRTRAHLVEVAAKLLADSGPDAVTTRSVALAAGVQAPTIYRLFGDKSGLLDAVAEHGFAAYMARKAPDDPAADPVENLHAGWELHIGFGLANPELFRLMHTALRTPDGQAAAAAGAKILRARVHRVAEAGRLRVTERRAIERLSITGGFHIPMRRFARGAPSESTRRNGWPTRPSASSTGFAIVAEASANRGSAP